MAEPTQTNISNTTIPDYAKPYVETMLGQAQALTDINQNPYQTYPGQRTADFVKMQNDAFAAAGKLGPAGQLGTATDLAQLAGIGALNTGYTPSQYGNAFNYAPQSVEGAQTNAAQAGAAPTAVAQNMQAYGMGAAPTTQAAQFAGPGNIGYQNVQNQGLAAYQMNAPRNVRTQQFTGDQVGQYMNPYLQNALEPQLQEIQRQYDITGQQERGQAVKQGAYGGSRQAVMQAENQRNKNIAMNQAIGQGYNTAYQNAAQQFNAQQQANLQAQQANQQAGLTTGQANLQALLGVQSLGAGQNLQAQLANQQAGLTAGQFNATNAYNAALQNAQLQQQANLANQALAGQYGLQQGQFGQAANAANQAAQNQFALTNQALSGQYGLANLANQQQANLQNAQLAQQANLANQNVGLQAATTGAQYGQAANQLNEQSAQYGAGLGLQGLQTALQGAGALGNLGATQFGQQAQAIGLQGQMGGVQQQQQQNVLNQQYQDFLNQKQYPYTQLSYMSDMLRGLPLSQTSTATYQNPSTLSQVAGLGTAAAGAYGMYKGLAGAKEGGSTKDIKKRPAGLAELALSKMA